MALDHGEVIISPTLPFEITKIDMLIVRDKRDLGENRYTIHGVVSGAALGGLHVVQDGIETLSPARNWNFEWEGDIGIDLAENSDAVEFYPLTETSGLISVDGQPLELAAMVLPIVRYLQANFVGKHIRVLCPIWPANHQ